MELRQIEHAVAVATEGGFTAAADAVGITQPALSQSIAALERDLGTVLFERLPREVRLTAAGEAFLGPARQVLRASVAARAATEAVASVDAGRLDLVALPTLAVDPLVGLIGRFRARHPGVEVRVAAPDARAAVLDQVRRGDAELGLAEAATDVPGLEVHPIASQEILLAAPPGTRLPPSGLLATRGLADLDLVTTPPGTATRAMLDEACAAAGVEPRVVVETAHRETLAPLVLAGAGAALLAAPQAADAEAGGAAIARLAPPLRRELGFLHRAGPISPAAEAFLALADATPG